MDTFLESDSTFQNNSDSLIANDLLESFISFNDHINVHASSFQRPSEFSDHVDAHVINTSNDLHDQEGTLHDNMVTLRLHYVPGDHGSHGSPKRSAPCDLVNFCLGTQVLLSIITFRHGLSRYPLQTVG